MTDLWEAELMQQLCSVGKDEASFSTLLINLCTQQIDLCSP